LENNIYTKEDIIVLIELYKSEPDSEDYSSKIEDIINSDYDLTKLFSKKEIKLSHGNSTIVEVSCFSYIEKKHIFETIYEDIPLLINDLYINNFKPAALILKWRLKIGK